MELAALGLVWMAVGVLAKFAPARAATDATAAARHGAIRQSGVGLIVLGAVTLAVALGTALT